MDMGILHELKRAKKPARMPIVLTPNEARANISHMNWISKLIVGLLYGSGLRISEALWIRMLDVDIEYKQIAIRQSVQGPTRSFYRILLMIPSATNGIKCVKYINEILIETWAGFNYLMLYERNMRGHPLN